MLEYNKAVTSKSGRKIIFNLEFYTWSKFKVLLSVMLKLHTFSHLKCQNSSHASSVKQLNLDDILQQNQRKLGQKEEGPEPERQ